VSRYAVTQLLDALSSGDCEITLCRSYLKPYCMDRKTAFFSGHLNLRITPETGLPSGKKS